ncbi:hypothetical protein [Streptomyces sp. SID5910]|uniref:hypothetical protein n=1 Tax=Streptomyces sp. SID5910 TaxID=2690312 RepID=UPI0013AC91EA|nr:hypothetical protein [Streptomyces sp. SID5910]MYR44541.1 hypothetical protein [Streptomyces sp. SID5910]
MSTQADHGHGLVPRPEQTPDALRAALAAVDPGRLPEMQRTKDEAFAKAVEWQSRTGRGDEGCTGLSWSWEYAFGAEEAARTAPPAFLTRVEHKAAELVRAAEAQYLHGRGHTRPPVTPP